MILRSRRSLSTAVIGALVAAPLAVAPPAQAADPVTITLLDINDFHGRIDSNTALFAATIEKERALAGEDNTLFVSAGDNIGASVFASAIEKDKPAIDVLNALDLSVSAVGNHEFDRGFADLTDRIGTDGQSGEADFPYLGANVLKDGTPALDASETLTVGGVKVAVIGAVTEETPSLVSPGGMMGVTFTDPVDAVNAEAARLNALPADEKPDVIVATYHDGAGAGTPEGATLEQEIAAGGAFGKIVTSTDASVDAIFTGHTHKFYSWDAPAPGGGTRPIIQTGNYGENIGKITLTVDPDTDAVSAHTATNVARLLAPGTPNPRTPVATPEDLARPRVTEVKTITDAAIANAKAIGNVKKGEITADVTTAYTNGSYVDGKYTGSNPADPKAGRDDRANESTIGNLVPDAMLELSKSTRAPADLAVNNPGGLRDELFYKGTSTTPQDVNVDGVVTLAESNAVLPFANNLFTVSLTGASLKKVFEQQWQRLADGTVPSRPYLQLGMSKNVRYTFDATRPEGERVTSLWINDEPLDVAKTYKVVVPSFLATGGDNFRAFTEGAATDLTVVDYEGFNEYMGAKSPISPDFARRAVQVAGLADSYEVGEQASFSLPKLNLTSIGSPANTTVSATLAYGDGQTLDLGSQAVANGASGTFTFDVPAGAVGGGTITATASPSGTTATIPLSVEKAASTTAATGPEQVTKAEVFDVAVTVEAAGGEVAGDVTIKDGDTVVGEGTVEDGTGTVEVDASDLRLGKRQLTVEFGGSSSVAASSATVGVEVIKGETEFSASGSTTPYGTGATITMQAGPGATGIVYVFNQLGMTVGVAFLNDGAGTFRLGGTALKPGSYTYDLAFNGSAAHEPASASATVVVTKAATTTRAKVGARTTTRKRVTMTVKVKAAGFAPTGKVVVKRGAKTVGRGTVKNGVAKVKLDRLAKGKAKLTVTYGGNAVANGSSTTATIRVVK